MDYQNKSRPPFSFESTARTPLQRFEQFLQGLPVFRELLFIIHPVSTWNRVAELQRPAGFAFLLYLLPLMLLVGLVEGHGLIMLGREQVARGAFNRFTLPKVFIYELASGLLALVLMVVAAFFIKALANTCFKRNHLAQAFTVIFHAAGPLYLIQLLNGFPHMYLWLTWLAGMYVMIGTLYHGLPRIMQPDPPSAMGLYIGSASIVFLLMFIGRLVTFYYLKGNFRVLEKHLSDLAARLPF